MRTKRFLLAVLFTACTWLAQAQDKYQYAIIQFVPHLKNEIQISIDGKEYIEEKADFSPYEKAAYNINPLLKKITEFENKGWELLSYQPISQGQDGNILYHAFFRKKRAV